jgi:hypothetical protein
LVDSAGVPIKVVGWFSLHLAKVAKVNGTASCETTSHPYLIFLVVQEGRVTSFSQRDSSRFFTQSNPITTTTNNTFLLSPFSLPQNPCFL